MSCIFNFFKFICNMISNKFYVSNMDAYVFDGKIFSLECDKFDDLKVFELIMKDLEAKDE